MDLDSDGYGSFSFYPQQKGLHTLVIKAGNEKGNMLSLKREFYAYEQLGENWEENRVEVYPDKRGYQKNDTAVLINGVVLCNGNEIQAPSVLSNDKYTVSKEARIFSIETLT